MLAMTRDLEALQEVIEANPDQSIVFSYSSDLYLGELPPESLDTCDACKEEEAKED